jgi:multiple sugar transport system substrate-binding protein
MRKLSRRWVLRGATSLATAAALARPFIAKAAAKTAAVWWVQGFIREEDEAFRRVVAD